jgi:holo-[acyl-carrier protein] synthase
VDLIRGSIATHAGAYLERVYTAQELADCRTGAGADPRRLAARFAAKEAAFKALRIGDAAVSWLEVEISEESAGLVKLSLCGNAARLAHEAGITRLSLSISHRRECAVAVVVAEIQRNADT